MRRTLSFPLTVAEKQSRWRRSSASVYATSATVRPVSALVRTCFWRGWRQKVRSWSLNIAAASVVSYDARPIVEAKPDNLFYMDIDTSLLDLHDIPLKELPGVGYALNHTFKERGLKIVADVLPLSLDHLKRMCGNKKGIQLYGFCRGEDSRQLKLQYVRKSIAVDVNWGIRFENEDQVSQFFVQLVEELCARLSRCGKTCALSLVMHDLGRKWLTVHSA